MTTTHAKQYVLETIELLYGIDADLLETMAQALADLRDRQGRLFVIGVGGSAATASHAVNDFRKIAGIEAYAPTDNVAEITARTNDDGWSSTFVEWLKTSHLTNNDAVLVLSVGGGSHQTSANIVEAIKYARIPLGIEPGIGATILGIVSRDGGYASRFGDYVLLIPPLYGDRITPHCEGITSVLLHLLVSHPALSA